MVLNGALLLGTLKLSTGRAAPAWQRLRAPQSACNGMHACGHIKAAARIRRRTRRPPRLTGTGGSPERLAGWDRRRDQELRRHFYQEGVHPIPARDWSSR